MDGRPPLIGGSQVHQWPLRDSQAGANPGINTNCPRKTWKSIILAEGLHLQLYSWLSRMHYIRNLDITFDTGSFLLLRTTRATGYTLIAAD